MKKTIVTIATMLAGLAFTAASAAPLPEAKPESVGFSQAGLNRMDDFFAREIAAKRVPGAVVAVARDGKLVLYKAYGQLDPAKGTKMPLDAIFALASMTKPQATVAGLTLMEQGRLPLQAKVSDYFPAFADMKVGVPQPDETLKLEPQSSPIHIHDLYRHTSGLVYGGRPDSPSLVARQWPDGTAPAIEGDTQAFIDRITKLPLVHQPSTEFEYGFSIDVVGALVEKVSGQRLGDYLGAHVWKPLGMKDATFHPTDAQRPRLARPFPNDPLTGKPQAIKLLDTPTKFDCGGGVLVRHRRRLHPLRPDAAQWRRTRRPAHPQPADGAAHDVEPSRPRDQEQRPQHRAPSRRLPFRPRRRGSCRAGSGVGAGQSRRVHLERRLRHAVLLRSEAASRRGGRHRGARRTCENITASRCRTSSTAR